MNWRRWLPRRQGAVPDRRANELPTLRLDYPRAEIRILATTDMETKVRAHSCRKEPWTVAWIESDVGRGSVFYDIGANVGTFSLVAASQAEPPAVYAFEPSFRTYSALCDNILLNRRGDVITPIPLPIASRTEVRTFRYRTLDAGQSRHQMLDSGATPKRLTQRVLAIRLDDIVATFGLSYPTHIKLDVDGAELEVLQGAASVLRHEALQSLLIEIDGELWQPVIDLLAQHGFRIRETFQRKPTAPRYAILDRNAAKQKGPA
jgi:FkbM family methyltransferase